MPSRFSLKPGSLGRLNSIRRMSGEPPWGEKRAIQCWLSRSGGIRARC